MSRSARALAAALGLAPLACGAALPPPSPGVVPDGAGWFCYETESNGLTTCARTVEECERGARVDSGRCSLRDRAWCFTATNEADRASFVCGGAKGDCTRMRGNLTDPPLLHGASACAELR